MKKPFFYISLIFLTACMEQNDNSSTAKEEIIASDKAMSKLASEIGFSQALMEYADEEFTKFNDGEFPVIGKNAFAEKIKDKKITKTLSWEPVKAEAAKSGELGYTWGNWKFIATDTTYYGNYFTVWKKQADGKWKVTLDGGNNTPKP